MPNFLDTFADTTKDGQPAFSNGRSGTIVGLLSIGTLIGALAAAPIADRFGRRYSIVFWNLVFCVGLIVQITTDSKWYQLALGRWVAGLGVGGLSVLTVMYQSETAPKQVRGALVSSYQLFITLGIFVANCINYGTEKDTSSRSWKLVIGIGFIWPAIMAVGIMTLRESPRWDYRHGRVAEAKTTLALSYSVPENHREVHRELREIREKLELENAGGGKHKFYEVFTGPRMLYRVLLGVALQALQQLTGANFFFYYGTTIFQATGLKNSYVTSMILGGVNFGMTFFGLYVVEHFGRRKALIFGGLWMFMCFMVFASVGHFSLDQVTPTNTPAAGTAMIVFACLFIAVYAMTWAYVYLFPSLNSRLTQFLDQSSGLLLESYILLVTEQLQWVLLHLPTGPGIFSSPSSRLISQAQSTTDTATSSQPVILWVLSLSTSLCVRLKDVVWKRLIQCTSCMFLHARVQSGSPLRMRNWSRQIDWP